MNSKTILFIHQSSELYGSDKTLFYLAEAISRSSHFNAIVVIPDVGPLKDLLEEKGVSVIVSPIAKLSRQMFTPKGLLNLPFVLISSFFKLRKSLHEQQVDIVHSNTMAVLVGAFYSKIYRIKHIWHIHEIIEKPKVVKSYFPKFVNLFSNKVVYNSDATRNAFTRQSKNLIKKSTTILNGLNRQEGQTALDMKTKIRRELFGANKSTIIIGLIGRINNWKGHKLLLEAFADLSEKHEAVKLVFVGSAPPSQEYIVSDLKEKIIEKKLESKCLIIPFQNDIWKIYDSIDISVIPSTEPEPFGLVALESMLSQKAVIAANHGGVAEIVKHNKTGFLFEPNNANELKLFLEQLVIDKNKRFDFGREGSSRAKDKFSLDVYVDQFINLYSSI